MPVISSIIRYPEATGLNIGLTYPARDNVDKAIEADNLGLPDPPETLSLVAFVHSLDVEQKDLNEIKARDLRARQEPGLLGPAMGTTPSEYIIGTGASSTVMLLTPPEDIQPSTTLVAYKRYTAAHLGPTSDKKIYHWLWHELTSLCHPTLRGHENICKLQHIAWEDTSVLPILGLEFAQFGTLADCLQDLRSYSSRDRKSHLSLDIALGVAAIHSAGLVHGDLKPRNILVTHHPFRHVVAQISDLTGVAATSSYGATEFAIRTRTWQSPEALHRHRDTDWQLADVYSFGMIVSTLWSAKGFIPLGGTFLDPYMQYQLDDATKLDFIESMKLVPDEDEGSMTKLACQSLPPTGTIPIRPRQIAKSTLCRHQRNRKPMQDVLTDCFLPWAQEADRDMTSTTATEHQSSPVPWNDNLVHIVETACTSFTNRPASFQANFFRALLAAGETIKKSLPVEKLTDLEEDTPHGREELRRHIRSIRSNNLRKSHRNQRIVSALKSLGFSYIWGLGVDVDEQVGLEWLALAARLGNSLNQTIFCLLEETAERRLSVELPRKLWCAVTMFNYGGVTAVEYLKDTDPDLYAAVESSSKLDLWLGTNRLCLSHMCKSDLQIGASNIDMDGKWLDPKSLYGQDHRTALHLCAMAGEQPSVEYLLVEKQVDINATTTANETPIFHAVRGRHLQVARYLCQQGAETHHINKGGLTILHLLHLMDDSDAAELAPLLVHSGAKLHHGATESVGDPGGSPEFPWEAVGTPLLWAAAKCRPMLFTQLLSLHSTISERLSIPDYKAVILSLSICHHVDMLSLAVKAEPDVVNRDLQPANPTSLSQLWQGLGIKNLRVSLTHTPGSPVLGPDEYTLALLFSMNQGLSFDLFRRTHHRKDFRQAKSATIKLLLSLGANPALPTTEDAGRTNALHFAIQQKDMDLFGLFIDNIRSKGIDTLPILTDLDRFHGCTALQKAIANDARDIFLFLLNLHPKLVNIPTRVGLTPLHFAVVQTWSGYARELLSHGADPYAEAKNGLRPFVLAVEMNPDAESSEQISEIIYGSAERDKILGPSQKGGGFTAFGRLLYSRNLTADRIERFIRKYGKPSYQGCPSRGSSVFECLLRTEGLPSHNAAHAQRGAVMEMLVKLFPSKINACDIVCQDFRLTPLQFAAYYGDVSAVEVLAKHGAELELEVVGDGKPLAGHTAVGLALLRKFEAGCPPWVLEGGRQERELFNGDLERILDILVRRGSKTAGSGAEFATSQRLDLMKSPHLRGVVSVKHPNTDDHRCMRRNQGDWPRMMPWEGNRVSPLDPEVVEITWHDGLSRVSSCREFRDLEIRLSPCQYTQPGHYVAPVPEPPKNFGAQLHCELEERWENWKSTI